MNSTKRIVIISVGIFFGLFTLLKAMPAQAAFSPNILLDDAIMDNTSAMNVQAIDNFLNTFPSSCLSTNNGFTTPDPTGYSPSTGFTYGGNVTAGRAIFDTAMAYSLNPQVILATLQKESSVVSGDASYHCTYINTAMGYGCPDSGSCPTNPATMSGFSKQIIHAAWLLKFGEQRSKGNTGWNVQTDNSPVAGDHWDNSDDPATSYGGPMTQGNFKRSAADSLVYYDGYSTIDGTSVHMDSGATAALYWYTPHFSGNQNFDNIFTQWFGGVIGASYFACHNVTNIPGIPSGQTIIPNRFFRGGADNLTLVHLNNTGSNCIEVNVWNPGYQSWLTNVATNMPAANPASERVIHADTDGDGQDELLYIHYTGTGSGKVEISTWKPGYQTWLTNIVTNLPCISPDTGEVFAGDTNGDGKDELMFAQYYPTGSGKVEIHTWNPGYQSWQSNIATNLPNQPSSIGRVIAGKVNGSSGPDSVMYVQYYPTGSNKVEVHTWNPGYQSWQSNIPTNLPAGPPSRGQVIAGNVTGDGLDRLIFTQYGPTGSGKVEVHTWNPGYQSWLTNMPTNLSELQQ